MARILVSLLLLTTLPCLASTLVGYSQPFYIDTGLDGGDVGGYGIHLEYSPHERWFIAYDRLQRVKRRDDGEVNNQDFITGGYRYTVANGFQTHAGIAINERSDVLGSPTSFNIGVGYQFDRIRVSWNHWSNANTNEVNHGFDVLTIAWRLKL